MDFEQHIYGMSEEGEAAIIYILRADNGAEVHITNYGASIVAVKVPDSDGKIANVVVAQPNFEAMLKDRKYLGHTVDWASGLRSSGLHNTMWESRFETNRVVMSQELEGANESVAVEAIFDFDDDMTLEITYLAKSNGVAQFDITSNIYMNLSGDMQSSIEEHEVKINNGDSCIDDLCKGDLCTDDLCMDDFCKLASLFDEGGAEQDFAKSGYQRGILSFVAQLRDPKSRRLVEILSSQEGLNLYRGDRRKCVALTPRTLNLVDTPAEEVYCQKVVYKFSIY